MRKKYIVNINNEYWLAPWTGDPGRTLVKENAKKYTSMHGAKTAAGIAIRKRPWRDGKITVIIETIEEAVSEQTISYESIKLLRHMLGVNDGKPKSKWGFRNYFAAGSGQLAAMEILVSQGLVRKGADSSSVKHLTGGLTYFHATKAGCEIVGLNKSATTRALNPR